MLARVRSFRRAIASSLLAITALSFGACASHEQPPLLSDGTTGRESQLPWNKQEKWESTGQAGALAEELQSR